MSKSYLALAALLASFSLHATEVDLTINGLTKHNVPGLNGLNQGAGVHVGNGALSYDLGEYRNSYKHPTWYALAEGAPFKVGDVRLGAFAGLASGYTDAQNTARPFVGGLAARWQPGVLGVSLHLVPPVGSGTAGFVAVQFTIKLKG
jgi:hypothetical protein